MPKEAKKAAKASTTARLKEVLKEKRLKPYRPSCPKALRVRIERASTQKLYLIQQSQVPDAVTEGQGVDFTVLGSTGNVYTVQFGHVPKCNCPDFEGRADMCKHIMFILLKVMGLSPTNPLSYQKAYLSEELQELYTILRTRRVGGSVRANALVCAAAASGQSAPAQGVTRRELTPDDSDCPICFDTLDGGANVTFCRGACGANFHAACIQRWLSSQSRSGCPNCRQPWLNDGEKKKEGYTNLGALQGQSAVRDTSTYYYNRDYHIRDYEDEEEEDEDEEEEEYDFEDPRRYAEEYDARNYYNDDRSDEEEDEESDESDTTYFRPELDYYYDRTDKPFKSRADYYR